MKQYNSDIRSIAGRNKHNQRKVEIIRDGTKTHWRLKYGFSKSAELKAQREDPLIFSVKNGPILSSGSLPSYEKAEANERLEKLRQQEKRKIAKKGTFTSQKTHFLSSSSDSSDSESTSGSSSSSSSSSNSSSSSSSGSSSDDSNSSSSSESSDSSSAEKKAAKLKRQKYKKRQKRKQEERETRKLLLQKIDNHARILKGLDESHECKATVVQYEERLNKALSNLENYEAKPTPVKKRAQNKVREISSGSKGSEYKKKEIAKPETSSSFSAGQQQKESGKEVCQTS